MRWRTRWPRVETVVPQPECVPWADAGQLLARLHGEAIPRRVPPMAGRSGCGAPSMHCGTHTDDTIRPRGSATARRSVAGRVPGSADARSCTATGTSASSVGGRPRRAWVLIDVDDLGVGDPAWDLARPAGFWAAGLIPDADWTMFFDAYREAADPRCRTATRGRCSSRSPAPPSSRPPRINPRRRQSAAGRLRPDAY